MIITIHKQATSEERAQLMALLCRITGSQCPITTNTIGDREVIAFDGQQIDAAASTALEEQTRNATLPFATIDARSGRIVGTTRFANLEYWSIPPASTVPIRPPAVPYALEIGWTWLAPDVQRTAINTEAKRLMLAHAFERWEVYRVTLKTDGRNVRSRNAIERIGCKLDGVVRAHSPSADGGPRDVALYSMLAREWPDARARLDARLARGSRPAT